MTTAAPNLLALDLVTIVHKGADTNEMRRHLAASLVNDVPPTVHPLFILELVTSLASLAAGLLDALSSMGVDTAESLAMATIEHTMELGS